MPTKASKGKGGKKNAMTAKGKSMVDKTFGMKNKNKSKKVQQYVSQQVNQAKNAGRSRQELDHERKMARERENRKRNKKDAEFAQQNSSFMSKDAISAKNRVHRVAKKPGEVGYDPSLDENQVCSFFLQGKCRKGNKCKFSHDSSKATTKKKLNVYEDAREKKSPTDELTEALSNADKQQMANGGNANLETSIICKFFLDAVEKGKFGFFWTCPNEAEKKNSCIYRHKLPAGFVLKSADEEKDDDEERESLIQEIERLRGELVLSECTMVTEDTFAVFQKEMEAQRKKENETKRAAEEKKSGGRNQGLHVLSGRALFEYDSSLFVDDAAAARNDDLVIQDSDDEGKDESKAAPAKKPSSKGKGKGNKPPSSSASTSSTTPSSAQPGKSSVPAAVKDAALFMDDDLLGDDSDSD
jgi:hypothetical protein